MRGFVPLQRLTLLCCRPQSHARSKWLGDRRTTHFDNNKEVRENGNLGVAIRRAGLNLGIAIVLGGALVSGGQVDFLADLKLFVIDGALAVLLLFIWRKSL